MVARGMVLSGSCTSPAGIVAASTPMKENSVYAITAVRTSSGGRLLALNGPRFEASNARKPSVPISRSGTTLRIVRISETNPPVTTPWVFKKVSTAITLTATTVLSSRFSTTGGISTPR